MNVIRDYRNFYLEGFTQFVVGLTMGQKKYFLAKRASAIRHRGIIGVFG